MQSHHQRTFERKKTHTRKKQRNKGKKGLVIRSLQCRRGEGGPDMSWEQVPGKAEMDPNRLCKTRQKRQVWLNFLGVSLNYQLLCPLGVG
jgi:hypothetical protein